MKRTTLILLALIVFFLFLGINLDINIYDEGIALVGAENILNGKLPYLDFWTIYSPGWFLLLSLWLTFFGKQIIWIRILTTTINALNLLIFYHIIKKETQQEFISLTLTIILTGLFSLNPFYARNVPFAITLLLLSLYLLLTNIKHKYIYLGLLTGILFTIRHDFAFYLSLILISFWMYKLLLDKSNFQIKEIKGFFLTFLIFLSFFVSVSFSLNFLEEFIQDAIVFPLSHFRETRSLPFPNPIEIILNPNFSLLTKANKLWEAFVFYFPLIVLTTFFVFFLFKKISIKNTDNFLILSILGTIFLSFQALTRSDVEHIIPAIVFSLFSFAKLVMNFLNKRKFLIFALMLTFIIPPSFKKIINVSTIVLPGKSIELASPYAKFIKIRSEFSYYNDLMKHISENCKNGRIFSGVRRHDRIYINDVIIYYLIGKEPPTKYYELHPGVATSRTVQERIISDLNKEKVDCIVLYDTEVIEKQNYKGSNVLDHFINENFELNKVFGKYWFLAKKH